MPKAHANGIDIYYEIHGAGQPLVLIAGLGYSSWMWHKMIPGLAQHFQVIAFDNRGVGETDKPTGPYTAQMLADDTAGLLAALGIQRAAILGHSMGGFVAQALVLSHPEMIGKLILSATNFGGPRAIPVTPEALAVLTDTKSDPVERLKRGILISCTPGFGDAHPEIVQEWVNYRVQHPIDLSGYQAQIAIGMALLAEDKCFEHCLKQIQTPTLILFGEHDKVVPPGNAELLAREIRGSRIEILKNAGHFYPFDATDAAVIAIVGFLK
ncbi:MAG: alpha/beta fold hydrolase [Chloroflexi bacterium]|nr:alpha/beta fold hydrolase [Chloroflexota bacterium]